MPQLTVVVPLMDQVDAFENTLASILRFQDRRIQLVVTHDGRYDDPHRILDEVESVVIPSHRNTSVIGRVAAAVDACHSPWIHWIAPGIEATEGWCDELLESLSRQTDLGLVSPRITQANDPAICVASSVMSQLSGHAQYLEDVWGEDWTLEDVQTDSSIVGPTGWAGFCRKQLLEQWHSQWHRNRMPEGYAELSLGLSVEADGWQHQIVESYLTASDEMCQHMERGFARDGRAAATIVGRLQSGSAVSKLFRSLGYAAKEIATGILYPGNFGVAVSRLCNLGQATSVAPAVSTLDQDSILTLPESEGQTMRSRRRQAA